ncbi:MAG: hypothetical protein EOP06_26010, partial [Proteobacteria bacterium]
MSKLYTKEEVAERIGKKPRTVEEHQKNGFLKPTSVANPKGRPFTRYTEEAVQELETYLAERDAEPSIIIAPRFAESSADTNAESGAEPSVNSSAESGLAMPEYTSQNNDLSALVKAVAQGVTESLEAHAGDPGVPIADKPL